MASILIRPPELLEADHASVLVGWESISHAKQYELEITLIGEEGQEVGWSSLSNKLKANQARKKNLEANKSYAFRVRYLLNADCEEVWSPYSERSEIIKTVPASSHIMSPPRFISSETASITVTWDAVDGAASYRLRYRQADSNQWSYVSTSIHGTIAKKKGLAPSVGYIFSIGPELGESEPVVYSASSAPMHVSVLAPFLRTILPSKLLSKTSGGSSTSLVNTDVIAGKVVAFYFSAHWCGPCRNFTPQLRDLYLQAKAAGKQFEVIFCSADHDEREFSNYYGQEMPWLAIPYDDTQREELMGRFKVSGIPRLSILASSGKLINDNAVSSGLSLGLVDTWINQSNTM